MTAGRAASNAALLWASDRACARAPVPRSIVWLLAATFVVCAAGSAEHLHAADLRGEMPGPGVRIAGCEFGWEGIAKVGSFVAAHVQLEGIGPERNVEVRLTVADGDGVPVVTTATARLARAGRTPVEIYAKPGRADGEATVEVLDHGRLLARRAFPMAGFLPSDSELLLVVGSPLGFALEGPTEGGQRPSRMIQVEHTDQLPTRWYGYEGVDAVVLVTSAPERIEAIGREQLAALERWVQSGGKVILFAAKSARRLLGRGAPLARFAPGELTGAVTLRELTALETYVESGDRVDPIVGGFEELRLEAPQFRSLRGNVEVFEGVAAKKQPLVVRTPKAFGQVVLGAFDIDSPPLRDWSGRERLFELLMGRLSGPTELQVAAHGQVTTLGFTDIMGQLHAALEQFPGVRLVPFSLLAGLVIVYIALVGPLDYLLLRKWLGRMELTWVTFPTVALVFCIAAWVLAHDFKGRELRLNQLDIIDLDAESGVVRGTSLARFFTPEAKAYNLAFVPAAGMGAAANEAPAAAAPAAEAAKNDAPATTVRPAPSALISWLGLPGKSFGGIDASIGAAPLLDAPYRMNAALDEIEGMPVPVWSTKGVMGRWLADQPPPNVGALVDEGGAILGGRLTNPLPVDLKSCVLVYDRWAYRLGRLARGASVTIDDRIDPQTVEAYFRHFTVRSERDISRPYDRESLDVAHIAEMLMFHDWAGGPRYTGLSHRYQPYLDASSLLATHRAVLLGQGTGPAATLTSDGAPLSAADATHRAFYRIVLPVRQP